METFKYKSLKAYKYVHYKINVINENLSDFSGIN